MSSVIDKPSRHPQAGDLVRVKTFINSLVRGVAPFPVDDVTGMFLALRKSRKGLLYCFVLTLEGSIRYVRFIEEDGDFIEVVCVLHDAAPGSEM